MKLQRSDNCVLVGEDGGLIVDGWRTDHDLMAGHSYLAGRHIAGNNWQTDIK